MKIILSSAMVFLFTLNAVTVHSQEKNRAINKADKLYDEYSFIEAQNRYEKIAAQGKATSEVYAKLGDTYFFNSDYINASKWYALMMSSGAENIGADYYFRYSDCLKAEGNYEEALQVLDSYKDKHGRSLESSKMSLKNYLDYIKEQSGRYINLSAAVLEDNKNNSFSEFGSAFVPKIAVKNNGNEKDKPLENPSDNKDYNADQVKRKDKYSDVIFASTKDSGNVFTKRYNWTKKPFLKLYSASITEEGQLKNVTKLKGEINSKYHQSTPVLTKDGNTMYFTRLVVGKDKNEIGRLKLFQAQKINDVWSNIRQLPYPINKEGTSSAHPALSPDNLELYFVSDRENKFGDTDLYVVSRMKTGGFATQVTSLGSEINTIGRETYPFVDNNGVLFFASDGHPSFGGLDVFAAAKNKEGKYTVINVGEPINSTKDDFAYIIDVDSKMGFFSSNRAEGKLSDKIYTFLETKPIKFPFNFNPLYYGTVKDSLQNIPIPGVDIIVYDENKQLVETLKTDSLGKYKINLPPLKNYTFNFKKKGYALDEIEVKGIKQYESKEFSPALFSELTLMVKDKIVHLTEGDNLTEKLELNPIYFDYDGYNLRKSSKNTLDQVIDLLKKNPSISLDIRSHTDSRGTDSYNLKLSKNRAKTTINYIINHGNIAPERVFGDGYGERFLINKCDGSINCTEEEHLANRRSEFIIVFK